MCFVREQVALFLRTCCNAKGVTTVIFKNGHKGFVLVIIHKFLVFVFVIARVVFKKQAITWSATTESNIQAVPIAFSCYFLAFRIILCDITFTAVTPIYNHHWRPCIWATVKCQRSVAAD